MLFGKIMVLSLFFLCGIFQGTIFAESPLRDPFKPVSISSSSTANIQGDQLIDKRPSMLMVKGVIWDDVSPVVMISYKSRNLIL